ncbi:MAG: hypothetical protein IJH63_08095 [Methanobrevibacter sp.]|uniref:Membrane protein YczE n=1 Tax=Methanobrevibacter millerae TaxID=230361 RepID=A0A8T3VGZ0_9EURY|nr:DUF6198 family protein [Methanobrevibacter millerae]MBE6505426.1 hypothetical protein [Methanobrevibacter millerae]MBQ6345631.1 hypothetical protein [Methanobrevibacter sp.]MBR0370662.1 hypothetical protein [Methanobrevibacter sp.]
MEFSGEKLTFKRIFNYIFGLFLITLGVAFSIKSGLGSTPVASIPYAFNLILNVDLGITTFVFQVFLVMLQLILLRRNFKTKHFFQLFVSVIFGSFTTFSMSLLTFIPSADNMIIALLMCVVSIILIAFGLFFYVPTNIVPISVDGITQTLAIVFNKPFSRMKVYFDVTIVLSSLILSYLFLGNFGSVGIGTVLGALCIGNVVKLIHKINYKLTGSEVDLKKM